MIRGIAEQTNEMIDSIGDAIKSIQDLSSQIALAENEQTNTNESININMEILL